MNRILSIKNKYKYFKYSPFYFLLEKIIWKRIDSIVNQSISFVKKDSKILDVGTGAGWIAEEFRRRKNADATLLDVIDFNQTDIKLVLYDGTKMPFEDNSFDSVFLNYILHHTNDPIEILKEAKRVCRGNIIIFEDTYKSSLGKFLLCCWDYISNLPSFLVAPFKENMPFNFKKLSEWENVFEKLGLKIIFEKEYSGKFNRHVFFVLEKL